MEVLKVSKDSYNYLDKFVNRSTESIFQLFNNIKDNTIKAVDKIQIKLCEWLELVRVSSNYEYLSWIYN